MRGSSFSDEQIIASLKEHDTGMPPGQVTDLSEPLTCERRKQRLRNGHSPGPIHMVSCSSQPVTTRKPRLRRTAMIACGRSSWLTPSARAPAL